MLDYELRELCAIRDVEIVERYVVSVVELLDCRIAQIQCLQ